MDDLNGWTFDGETWTKGAWTVARQSLVSWSLLRGDTAHGSYTEAGWAMLYADTMDTDERPGWTRGSNGDTWSRPPWHAERLKTGWVLLIGGNGRDWFWGGSFVELAEALHHADTSGL